MASTANPGNRGTTQSGYGKHGDRRTKRVRTRANAERAALTDWEDRTMGDSIREKRLAYVALLEDFNDPVHDRTLDEWNAALDELDAAFRKCLPELDEVPDYWLGLDEPCEAEDEYVFRPLLLDEFGGDREAAENAWALGQRPTGYPEE